MDKFQDFINALDITAAVSDEEIERTKIMLPLYSPTLRHSANSLSEMEDECFETRRQAITDFVNLAIDYDHDKDRKRIADSMAKEIHRLTDMDQQLMKLTAMGHEPPETERVSVTELLRETAERLQPQADGITIAVEGADSSITGDRELLSLLADNLAANAIHASSIGTTVLLRAEPNGFTVHDQGIGMSEETIRHACEPFWKADKARTHRQGGAGLGLALCTEILKLHGSELEIESAVGEGSCIGFRLAEPEADVLAEEEER